MKLSFYHSFAAGVLLGVAGTAIGASVLGSDVFDDVPRGSYFDAAIGELYSDGIIKGFDDGDFHPEEPVTRGQVAVMFKRFRDDLDGKNNNNDDDEDNDDEERSSSSRSSNSNTRSSSSKSSSSYSATSNNPRGAIRFTTTSYTVGENVSKATISVVRTGGNQGSVAISYAVTANSATAGTDFDVTSGTLNFDDKETSKTFQIDIKNDTSSEGNETINLVLSSPTNSAGLGNPSSATLTILDDESSNNSSGNSSSSSSKSSSSNPNGVMNFSALTYGFPEDAGSVTITVKRDGGTTGSVNVNYTTANGTGKSGTDYTSTSGTLSFASGETSKTFTVSVTDDSSVDGNKTFTITLSGQTGGAGLGSMATTTISLLDDETDDFSTGTGSLKFSKATYDTTEGSGKADVIVQRITGNKGTVSVNYATVSGTAFSGVDFTSTSGTVTFAPGETSKTITIPVTKDTSSESGDNFYVELSGPTANALLATPYSTMVTIYD